MAYTYETIQSIVPNAVMRKRLLDGVLRSYLIKPAEGYILHDASYDVLIYDEETLEPIGVETLGYRPTEGSVGYNYDFTPFPMQDETGNTVTAYGSRQFFCKPIEEVGEGAEIYGGGNDQEVM